MTVVAFPTQGEVLQFAFDVFGVLPRKHEQDENFNEASKKSTQTALRRLAKEIGQLDENLGKLLRTFSYLVASALPPREFLAFGDVFFDLFNTYRDALKTEGTYLSKPETARWWLLERGAPRLAISLAKQMQRYNVAADGLSYPPEAFWYLPKRQDDAWQWPLQHVMRWAYDVADTSIRGFHCPDEIDATLLERNFESAKNWLAGRNLPSWSSLLANFDQSFDALYRSRAARLQPQLSQKDQISIRTALFLARATTHASMLVVEHFGNGTLEEFCKRHRLLAECSADSTESVTKFVQGVIAHEQPPEAERDEVWFEVVTDYWRQFAERQDLVYDALARGRITLDQAIEASRPFGRLATLPFEQPDACAPLHSAPTAFEELLLEGLALRKSNALCLSSIDSYRARLASHDLEDALSWVVPWQQSSYYYLRGQYAQAFPFIQAAFNSAQHCAGANQYLLVNQYIELCAKNDRWKEFTRGVHWARYLGIEVRWLRGSETTTESLEFTFEMLRKAVYPV